jgi:hypothetical protein
MATLEMHPLYALGKLFLAKATVTSTIGSGASARLFTAAAPQNTAKPYVVMAREAQAENHTHRAGSSMSQPIIAVEVYADDYDTAWTLANELRKSADGYTGTLTDTVGDDTYTVDVMRCHRTDENDDRILLLDGESLGEFIINQTWEMSVAVTPPSF